MQSAGLAKATTMRAFRLRGDTDPHSSRNDLPAHFETVGGGDDAPAAPRGGTVAPRIRHVCGPFAVLALMAAALLGTGASEGVAAPVIVAAGDICGSATDCKPTARVIGRVSPRRVLTLGDNAYEDGLLNEYRAYYKPNWGRFKAKTSPVPGNHEFNASSSAAGYRDYFGGRAPALYYSYDLGSWHLIALTGDIDVSEGSPQEQWLRNDLAAHPSRCILAYWHEPRFTSGTEHFSDDSFDPFWRDLYAARADVVLNGHVHNYERFGRQNPNGRATRKGIREFVVGTGGVSHYTSGPPIAHSQVQNDTTFGVLKLTLRRGSYDWKFVRAAGARFHDSGTTRCSRQPSSFRAPSPNRERTRASTAPRHRYLYFSPDPGGPGVRNGWNLLDVGSKSTADALPAGAKGLVWVGDYDNDTCTWEVPNAELRADVKKAIGDRKVYGYFFSDEPNPYECKDAPTQHRRRSHLIHSIDPHKRTVIVLDSNGFSGQASKDALEQLPLWKGAANYIGLDPYPCYAGESCDFSWIQRTIRAANAARINYWGVAQAFEGDSWRWPTPAEEGRMLTQWARSKQSGYMTFAWDWSASVLPSHPDLLRVLRLYNKGAAPDTTITDGPSSTTTSRQATFSFVSSIPGSNFQCKLDSRRWSRCSSQRTYTSLSRGSHTFRVRATVFGRLDPTPSHRSWAIG
jgi:hypothetical protein